METEVERTGGKLMAQTEMILRLIKDGDIVGYEKRSIKGYIEVKHRHICHDNEERWYYGAFDDNHDSFELGIKVGDEYWFEGDRLSEMYHGCYHKGIIEFKDGCFLVEWDDDELTDFLRNVDDMKRIGNIHEQEGANHVQ